MKHLSSTTKFFLGAGCGIIGAILFALNVDLYFSSLMGETSLLGIPIHLWTYIGFGLPLIACITIYILCLELRISKNARLKNFLLPIVPLALTILTGLAALDLTYSLLFEYTNSLLMGMQTTEDNLIAATALCIFSSFFTTLEIEAANLFHYKVTYPTNNI